jgi:hypothetical protein
MTKNTHGGSKHKSFAKKHSGGGARGGGGSLRFPENDLEVFAVVTACHGNHFDAMTLGFPKITTFIRNKFSKHNKFSNTVSRGSIVMIGMREWESPNFKNADLLEVYDSNDISILSNFPLFNIQLLLRKYNGNSIETHHDFIFSNDIDHHTSTPTDISANTSYNIDHIDLDLDLI